MAIWLESLDGLEGLSKTPAVRRKRIRCFDILSDTKWRIYVAKRFDSIEKRLILLDEKIKGTHNETFFLEKQTKICQEAKARGPCCDKMKMALGNCDLKLVYDNNKRRYACIEHWKTFDATLFFIEYCPWCGERIEME